MLENFKKYKYLVLFFVYFPITAWAFDSFDCVGSEPSWKLSITPQRFTFQLQSQPTITMAPVEPTPSENMSIEHIRVFRTNLNNKNVTVIIQKQSCTDGTSEDILAYEGLFITNDKVFHGCCSRKLILTDH